MMKSWKPEFCVDGNWYDNAQRFATETEARQSAQERFSRWTVPTDYRAVTSPDPINYARVDGQDRSL